MPQKLVVKRVKIRRNGEFITPPINKVFDFTDKEVAELDDGQIRDPRNESADGPSNADHIVTLNAEIERLNAAAQDSFNMLQARNRAYDSMSHELSGVQEANDKLAREKADAERVATEALAKVEQLEAEVKTLTEAKATQAPATAKTGKSKTPADNDL